MGLDMDGALALDELVRKVDVVHEVLRPGNGAVVVTGSGDYVFDVLGHRPGVLAADDPDAADRRRDLAELFVDRPGIAGVAAVPVRGEDRELGIDGLAKLGSVVAAQPTATQRTLGTPGKAANLLPRHRLQVTEAPDRAPAQGRRGKPPIAARSRPSCRRAPSRARRRRGGAEAPRRWPRARLPPRARARLRAARATRCARSRRGRAAR